MSFVGVLVLLVATVAAQPGAGIPSRPQPTRFNLNLVFEEPLTEEAVVAVAAAKQVAPSLRALANSVRIERLPGYVRRLGDGDTTEAHEIKDTRHKIKDSNDGDDSSTVSVEPMAKRNTVIIVGAVVGTVTVVCVIVATQSARISACLQRKHKAQAPVPQKPIDVEAAPAKLEAWSPKPVEQVTIVEEIPPTPQFSDLTEFSLEPEVDSAPLTEFVRTAPQFPRGPTAAAQPHSFAQTAFPQPHRSGSMHRNLRPLTFQDSLGRAAVSRDERQGEFDSFAPPHGSDCEGAPPGCVSPSCSVSVTSLDSWSAPLATEHGSSRPCAWASLPASQMGETLR